MTGKEYVSLAMRTNDGESSQRLRDKLCFEDDLGDLINGIFGLMGETGEFADMIKKWIFHEHELDREHLRKEMGDIMWYVAMVCYSMGFNLDNIMEMNIDKLRARYPDGFDVQRSQHRKVGDL